MSWVAGALVAVAVWLGLRRAGPPGVRRLRPPPGRPVRRPGRGWRVGLCAGGVLLAGLAWLLWGGAAGSLTACAVLLALTGAEVARTTVTARSRRRARSEVVEACDVFAGMLRLGHIPATALTAAAAECRPLRQAAAAQAVGGDVVAALRRSAAVPGQADLSRVAAAWQVATATGASMTSTMAAVAASLRADEAVSGVVRAELSAPRATGRLLAALPLAGLGLGYVVGGDPIGFLTGGWIGQICLVGGVGLGCAGLLWTDRLADRAGAL